MDTVKWYEDPVYIKQCEKAEEIQQGHRFIAGDFFRYHSDYCVEAIRVYFGDDIEDELANYIPKEACIDKCNRGHSQYLWLPRQNDLQEMMGKTLFDLVYDFRQFLICTQTKRYVMAGEIASMEQLWLAFVMEERYNKVWSIDKNEWVSQSK